MRAGLATLGVLGFHGVFVSAGEDSDEESWGLLSSGDALGEGSLGSHTRFASGGQRAYPLETF